MNSIPFADDFPIHHGRFPWLVHLGPRKNLNLNQSHTSHTFLLASSTGRTSPLYIYPFVPSTRCPYFRPQLPPLGGFTGLISRLDCSKQGTFWMFCIIWASLRTRRREFKEDSSAPMSMSRWWSWRGKKSKASIKSIEVKTILKHNEIVEFSQKRQITTTPTWSADKQTEQCFQHTINFSYASDLFSIYSIYWYLRSNRAEI